MFGLKAAGNKRASLFSQASASSSSAPPFQSPQPPLTPHPTNADDDLGLSFPARKSSRSLSFGSSLSHSLQQRRRKKRDQILDSIAPLSPSFNDHRINRDSIIISPPDDTYTTTTNANEVLKLKLKSTNDDSPAPLIPRPPSRSPVKRLSLPPNMYTSIASRGSAYLLRTHLEQDGFDIDFDDAENEEKRGRSYTSELSDFLRETGPEIVPTLPPLPPLSESGVGGAAGLFGKFMKKKDKRSSRSSNTSSIRDARRATGTSFSSAASVAALNKALHHVPPPNIEPRIFANGQTIYMINRPKNTGVATSPNNLHVPQPQPRNVSGSAMTRQSLSSSSSSSIVTDSTTTNHTQNNNQHLSPTDHRRGSLATAHTNESYISNTSTTAIMTAAVIPSLSPARERVIKRSAGNGASQSTDLLNLNSRMENADKGIASDTDIDIVGYKLGGGGAGSGLSAAEVDLSDVDPDHQRRRQRIIAKSKSPSARGSPKRRERQRSGSLNLQNIRTTPPLMIRPHGSGSAASTIRGPAPGSETMHHSYLNFHSGNEDVDRDWVSPESASATSRRSPTSAHRVDRIRSQPQHPSSSSSHRSFRVDQRSASDAGIYENGNKDKAVADEDHADDVSVVVVEDAMKKRASERPRSMVYAPASLSILPQTLQSALPPVPRVPLPTLKTDIAGSNKASTSSRLPTSPKSVTSRSSLKRHGPSSISRPTAVVPSSALAPTFAKALETPPQSAMEQVCTPTATSPSQASPQGSKTPPIEFRGYMFPVPPATSSPDREEAPTIGPCGESSTDDDSDSGRVAKAIGDLDASRSSTSVFLDRQIVDVLKMSETYGALAEEGKGKQEKERSDSLRPSVSRTIMPMASTLGHPSASARNSISSSKSMSRVTSSGLGLTAGPPRLPLPPSPFPTTMSASPTIVGNSPIHLGGLASAFGSPNFLPASPVFTTGSTPQSQITSLTYALHHQRSRYESLSAQIIHLRAGYDQERAMYEAKMAELISRDEDREREVQELKDQMAEHLRLAEVRKQQGEQSRHQSYEQHYSRHQQDLGLTGEEREEYERRLKDFEKQVVEMSSKIVALEEARFGWERERKGLMWLVGRVGEEADGEEEATRALPMIGPSDSQKTAIATDDNPVQTSNAAVKRPGFRRSVTMPATLDLAAKMTASIIPINVTSDSEVPSHPKSINVSSHQDQDQKPITPLLNAFTISRPISTYASSLRTSLDEQLLQPRELLRRGTGSQSSLNVRRHSLHVDSPSLASKGGKRLSAALDDMLIKLRSLGADRNVGSAIAHDDGQTHTSFSVPSFSAVTASDHAISGTHPTIVRSTSSETEEVDALKA
ncbi:hypothetical protein FRB95_009459 [Tulasnella sp. JGI-2019a]|nr:hypothetical protein FRB95_009459 [Tulasnella sp. JGI-2019a]